MLLLLNENQSQSARQTDQALQTGKDRRDRKDRSEARADALADLAQAEKNRIGTKAKTVGRQKRQVIRYVHKWVCRTTSNDPRAISAEVVLH